MNIQDFMPTVIENGPYRVSDLLDARKSSFLGFCEVEKGQGGIDPVVDLSTPEGQRNARILFARTVEELTEARESKDQDHVLEELIDSLNFAASLIYLGGLSDWAERKLHNKLDRAVEEPKFSYKSTTHISESLLGQGVYCFVDFLSTLRNRSWQNSVQHPYFMGEDELIDALYQFWIFIIQRFDGWAHFSDFFMAKDAVLKFRLETKY